MELRSGNSETPITERRVCASNGERRSVRRLKCAPAGVRDELTVVSEVRRQLAEQRLVHQQRQLKLDAAGLAASGAALCNSML